MITVTIGSHTVTYHLVETDSPRAYDGFGTIELYNSGPGAKHPKRMVLVNTEHLTWQLGRYGSGLHTGEEQDNDASMQRYVADRLWKRLEGKDKAGD